MSARSETVSPGAPEPEECLDDVEEFYKDQDASAQNSHPDKALPVAVKRALAARSRSCSTCSTEHKDAEGRRVSESEHAHTDHRQCTCPLSLDAVANDHEVEQRGHVKSDVHHHSRSTMETVKEWVHRTEDVYNGKYGKFSVTRADL